MKTFVTAFVVAAVVAIGGGKEIYSFVQKLTSPASAMAQDQGQINGAISATRNYAGYIDEQTGRSADDYKYMCKKCKTGFDVPTFSKKCPKCSSKKFKENQQLAGNFKAYRKQLAELEQ
jgi:DNA-directed RNA polymerase subunit RPC12/RpoP